MVYMKSKGFERFGRAGPHTTEVTIISRVRELINFSYSGFRQKKYIPHRLSNMRAVLMVNRPSTHQCTSPSRSRESGSADVSVWLTTCMGHVSVGQTSPTVVKGMVSLFQTNPTAAVMHRHNLLM